MQDTLESHPDIHWPSGFSPIHAHSFCQAQAFVHGPSVRAFSLLNDVERWPEWVPGITEARFGTLARTYEVRFHEHLFEVIIGEHQPPRRLGWSVVGGGVQLYQAWLFTETEGGTHVVAENVVRGPAAKVIDTLSPAWAQRLNSLWLAQLRRLSATAPREENT
ncbi:hypothetical protein ABZ760_03275 [Streptomyces sp. NPDC006658]|uniref:hypothetical protein n=1 Tax=Streptomyces sp. NPDC006658 TaxID=3156900 RepID=UPI0033CC735B